MNLLKPSPRQRHDAAVAHSRFARDSSLPQLRAGMATDAFFVAFRLHLLRRLFAEGAFSQLRPILAEYKKRAARRDAPAGGPLATLLFLALTAVTPWASSRRRS